MPACFLEVDRGTTVAQNRFFVWTAANGYADGGTAGYPSAGADVDGAKITGTRPAPTSSGGLMAGMPGQTFLIEAGAAFSAGQLLETDSTGRGVPHSSGVAVARALASAAGAGSIVAAVFTSGR